jgi:hypothetical protein
MFARIFAGGRKSAGRTWLGLLCALPPVSCGPARLADAAPPARRSASTTAVAHGVAFVESGQVDELSPERLRLRSGCVRLLLGEIPRSEAAIAFTYLGPTPDEVPLASGELRRQIGLKLRASDTCNVVYVMWHVAPTRGIHVSVKSNPGQRRHDECGDRGYETVEGRVVAELPAIVPGARHAFAVRIERSDLNVTVDGRPVWEGTLPPSAFAFDGPPGIRSDNAAFDVELGMK